MQTVKCNNISVSQPDNHDDYCSLKSVIEKFYNSEFNNILNFCKENSREIFHAVRIADSKYLFSVYIKNDNLLFGFYDTQNQILVDNVKANDIILLNENNFKDLIKRLEFSCENNSKIDNPKLKSAWNSYNFLYKESCRFIVENKFNYNDFYIRTGNSIDFKLTDNYFAGSLYCRFNPLLYNFKYIDGNNKEIPFTSITPKLWAEEVFPKINIIGDFIKGNVERFQARINGNYDLKEKYPHFNCDDIIKEVNNRIQAQKELQTMNKIIWDFGNSLASRKIIEPEFIVNDLNLKATVNHKISVPVVHLCIEDSEIIFRDPLNNEIEFASEVKAKLQNELDTILKATFERMDNGLNKGGLIIDSSYEEPDFE